MAEFNQLAFVFKFVTPYYVLIFMMFLFGVHL